MLAAPVAGRVSRAMPVPVTARHGAFWIRFEVESPIRPARRSARAQVTIVELSRAATTDARGAFVFADVPAGRYTLVARRLGYAAVSRTVRVARRRSHRRSISACLPTDRSATWSRSS